MMRTLLLPILSAILLSTISTTAQSGYCSTTPASTHCIKIGSTGSRPATAETPAFDPEDTHIQYSRKKPRSKTTTDPIANVLPADQPLYQTTRQHRRIFFRLTTIPADTVTLRLGFVGTRYCSIGGATVIAKANGKRSLPINGYKSVGCNSPFFIMLRNVTATPSGEISVRIWGKRRRTVSLATVCLLGEMRELLTVSPCTQTDCLNWQGCGDYSVIHGSLAIPGAPCTVRPSASAELLLPENASVMHANLQWAASGLPSGPQTQLSLNGHTVLSQTLFKNRDFEPFYGASADVTSLIRDMPAGLVNVSGMFHSPHLSCPNAHLAAWSLTTVFASRDVPYARINLCSANTETSLKKRFLNIDCMVPDSSFDQARSTVVAVEGESWKEKFRLNGELQGKNLFSGKDGERFDVMSFDVAKFLTGNTSTLVLEFDENQHADSVIITSRMSYQRLPDPISKRDFMTVVEGSQTDVLPEVDPGFVGPFPREEDLGDGVQQGVDGESVPATDLPEEAELQPSGMDM